jgi:hypothetical protein
LKAIKTNFLLILSFFLWNFERGKEDLIDIYSIFGWRFDERVGEWGSGCDWGVTFSINRNSILH